MILTTSLVTALYLYHYFTVHKVTDPSLYLLYRTLWPVVAPGILFHIPVEDSSIEASQQAIGNGICRWGCSNIFILFYIASPG